MGIFDKLFSRRKAAPPEQPASDDDLGTSTVFDQVAALMNRGRKSHGRRDFDAAIAAFSEVIALVPTYGMAYFDRGTSRAAQDNDAAAIADFDIAIALLPAGEEQAAAYHNRGVVHESLEHLPHAIRDLRAAQALGWTLASGELDRIRARHGEVAAGAPDVAKATALCDEARRLFATAPLDALVRFHQATEFAPELQDALHGLGIVNAALRRNEEALVAFDRSLTIEPQHPGMRAEALFNRSQLLNACGDLAGAIADLEACLVLSRSDGVRFPHHDAFVEGIEGRLNRLRAALPSP